jgi:hypothetical protein
VGGRHDRLLMYLNVSRWSYPFGGRTGTLTACCRALFGSTDLLAAGRRRLWSRYSLRSDRGALGAPAPFQRNLIRLGPPRLLWATRRRFDPSSSPSARLAGAYSRRLAQRLSGTNLIIDGALPESGPTRTAKVRCRVTRWLAPATVHTVSVAGMVMKDGHPLMPFGIMGGHFQPMGQSLFLTNHFEFGLDIQEALDLPRLFPRDGRVEVERGIPGDSVARLAALGHRCEQVVNPHGGGQAIFIDRDRGWFVGGSDPRKDGCALGY